MWSENNFSNMQEFTRETNNYKKETPIFLMLGNRF